MRKEVLKIIRNNFQSFTDKLVCSDKFLSYFGMKTKQEIITRGIYNSMTGTGNDERYKSCKLINFLMNLLDGGGIIALEAAFLFLEALHDSGQIELRAMFDEILDQLKLFNYTFKGVEDSGDHMRELCSSCRVYNMAFDKRGICLIINIKYFDFPDADSSRPGSERDVENLEQVFGQLGFDVQLKTDLTGEEIKSEVNKFVSKLGRVSPTKYGAVVMVIMSHGGRGGLICSRDGRDVNQYELYRKVNTCGALRGKPKVFIVQACAGEDRSFFKDDPKPPRQRSEELSELIQEMEESHEDTLIITSSFDGFRSIRHPSKGSPFITALVMTLEKHSGELHFEKICKKVQNEMREFNKVFEICPIPCYLNFLRRKLYFFPGLKDISSIQRETEPEEDLLYNYTQTDDYLESNPDQVEFKYLLKKDNAYQMSDGKKGRCLIINITRFTIPSCRLQSEAELSNRHGSEHDANLLKRVFEKLDFDVPAIKEDLKSIEIEETIEKELAREDHSAYGMFVLVLMSHGNKGGWIIGSDGDPVDQHKLRMKVYNCEALKNKPKFFIIDAYAAGEYKNFVYETGNYHGSVEDVLIVASSLEGIGQQMPQDGASLFIKILATLLKNHSHEWHLEKICKKTQDEMRKFCRKRSVSPVQIACYAYFLRKKLFLLPGLSNTESEALNGGSENETMTASTEQLQAEEGCTSVPEEDK